MTRKRWAPDERRDRLGDGTNADIHVSRGARPRTLGLANLFAFRSLLEYLTVASAGFVRNVLLIRDSPDVPVRDFPEKNQAAADLLRDMDPRHGETLETLGLWAREPAPEVK